MGLLARQNEYRVTPDAADPLARIFGRVARGEGFGNARYSRTIFEQALNAQALRLAVATQKALESRDAHELMSLNEGDFAAAGRTLGEGGARSLPRRRLWRRAS